MVTQDDLTWQHLQAAVKLQLTWAWRSMLSPSTPAVDIGLSTTTEFLVASMVFLEV